MSFKHAEKVEVCKKEAIDLGSYYPAMVLAAIGLNKYLVRYETRLTGDKKRLLTEAVDAGDIRPSLPESYYKDYKEGVRVDTYVNGGWWVGSVTKIVDPNYTVSLDKNGVLHHSPFYKVRIHFDWEYGNWVYLGSNI
ncbi:hypothetical protein M5689_008963 [Euphorbia peplus]|nr:hypothetical protein M5689_008963 [Euphorbia peplus]